MLDVASQTVSPRSEPRLSAVGISKRYGKLLSNDNIDLDLYPAEIHALLGENGAGKSTLVKAMYGLIQPSGGELRWMGQKIALSGPSEARALGIGMVFQHFSAKSQAADPRRADRRPHAAGGGAAFHRARPAPGRRTGDPLHQSQARRGEAVVQYRHDPARRQESGDVRSAGRRPLLLRA